MEIWRENEPKEALLLTREEVQKLSGREAQEETMFLGLRMMEGVSEAEFAARFHHTVEEIYGDDPGTGNRSISYKESRGVSL